MWAWSVTDGRIDFKLTQKWKDLLETAVSESDHVLNVHTWLARATLDAIGEGTVYRSITFNLCTSQAYLYIVAFDYQCGALDEKENPVMETYKNML